MFRRKDTLDYPLYVVTVVFNSPRWRVRWSEYEDFAKRVEEGGAILYTAEVAYGDRNFVIDPPGGDRSRLLRLRTNSELWLKENALNLVIQRAVEGGAKKVAWVDCDVAFARDDIFDETLHALQRYDAVQMWSEADDLSDQHEHVQRHKGFVYSWMHELPRPNTPGDDYYYTTPAPDGSGLNLNTWHPGFAWGWDVEKLGRLGGLLDIGIAGAGDSHMANALIGFTDHKIPSGISQDYRDHVNRWRSYADEHIKQNIGYVPGLLLHHWHGPKVNRQYKNRWRILTDNGYEPSNDIVRDTQGLYRLNNRKPQLRDDLRRYFNQRNEDTPHVKG